MYTTQAILVTFSNIFRLIFTFVVVLIYTLHFNLITNLESIHYDCQTVFFHSSFILLLCMSVHTSREMRESYF